MRLPQHLAENPLAFLADIGIELKPQTRYQFSQLDWSKPIRMGTPWPVRSLVGGLLIWRLLAETPTPLLIWGGRRQVREQWIRALLTQMISSKYIVSSHIRVTKELDSIFDTETGQIFVQTHPEFALEASPEQTYDILLPDLDWHNAETLDQASNYAVDRNVMLFLSDWPACKFD